MTLDPKITLQLALDRAAAEGKSFAERKQELHAKGGSVYTPQELAKREQQLVTEFDTQLAVSIGNVDQEIKTAERELTMELGRDPVDALSPDELKQAVARAPFAQHDAESLPLADLEARCRAALLNVDKAQAHLLVRYVSLRVARERKQAREPGQGLDDEDTRALRLIDGLLGQLADVVSNHKKRRAAAQERLSAAKKARLQISVLRNQAVNGDLARASHAAMYLKA